MVNAVLKVWNKGVYHKDKELKNVLTLTGLHSVGFSFTEYIWGSILALIYTAEAASMKVS